MAFITGSSTNWTPTATADTTNLADTTHMSLQGASGTQVIRVSEFYMGGLATVASPCIMAVARHSTVGITLSGGRNAANDPATAALALPPVLYTTATTKPQRSATLWLASPAFNANGGVVRWVAAPRAELVMLGNTASFGELGMSAFTGGTVGVMSSHFVYEPQ